MFPLFIPMFYILLGNYCIFVKNGFFDGVKSDTFSSFIQVLVIFNGTNQKTSSIFFLGLVGAIKLSAINLFLPILYKMPVYAHSILLRFNIRVAECLFNSVVVLVNIWGVLQQKECCCACRFADH